jgi:serine protease AprX
VSKNQPRRPSRRPLPARVWVRLAVALLCACALAAPLAAGADPETETLVAPGLLNAAEAQPTSEFKVIVQGATDSGAVASDVGDVATAGTGVERSFETVPAVAATLTGSQIVSLTQGSDPLVITRDAPVAVADSPTPTHPPTVVGSARVGETLSASEGEWVGAAQLGYSFQWERCSASGEACRGIDGQTGTLFTPASGDVGATVRVTVTASGGDGSTTATSLPTPVIAAEAPAGVPSTDEPIVSGEPEPGQFLTATPGATTGGGALTYSYQWLRCASTYTFCTVIPGAESQSYRVTPDDLGKRLRVVVIVRSEAGVDVAASARTELVAARPPVVTSPPSILGTSEEGQTLNAANGSWDGTQPLEFGYQWQRCDAQGLSCVEIVGATEPSYTLAAGDLGTTTRLAVTARGLGGDVLALSEPSEVVTAVPDALPRFKQHWPYVAGVTNLLSSPEGQNLEPPTIAIVDSGIDAGRADFGGRVIEQVTLSTRADNQAGDGNGHGTAVASVAAGEAEGYTGAAPEAKLVAIDVLDDDAVANVSDVIAAADWIYTHHERLNIRVANFSLHGTTLASLGSDPLDQAVERLWLSGIVVVTAAGNYAVDGEESAVPFAPGNDPFVLTVGATDTRGSFTTRDDVAAPWSAWGYTRDGFAKPELSAPGRYIAAAVSANTKLVHDRPERIVEPGYMQLSGTSLAAPVVAGSAANLLAVHPEWSPDQVKGALMLSAEALPRAPFRSAGVGVVNVARAAAVADPPNPNLALNDFLVTDPAGGPTQIFDADSWTTAVESDAAWGSAAWGSAAWGSAAWGSAAWGSAAWGSAAWGSAAWGSAAWGSAAWGSAAWGSAAWGSHVGNDVRPEGVYWINRN